MNRPMGTSELKGVKICLMQAYDDAPKRIQFSTSQTEIKKVNTKWDISDNHKDYVKALVKYLFETWTDADEIVQDLDNWQAMQEDADNGNIDDDDDD